VLAQRIATAVVMLLVLALALWSSRPEPLLLLLIALASCALWEWLRLIAPRAKRSALIGAMTLFALLTWLALQWFDAGFGAQAGFTPWAQGIRTGITQWLIPLAALLWLVGATAAVVRAGQLRAVKVTSGLAGRGEGQPTMRQHRTTALIAACGAVIAVWAALALLYQTHGVRLLLSLMMLVWSADVAAYFVGRAWGRHKLAPQVSPGKTWEGAAGGVLAAVLWALVSVPWEGSFSALLAQRYSLAGAALLTALLAALSIVGDLYESLLKRRADVKDSSGLLPGHGGVLDRIDALLPVAPAAYCLLHLWP